LDLTQWLYDLACCHSDLKRIDFDGVEAALEELEQRADQAYLDYGEPDSTATEEERAALLEMAELLRSIANDIDLFLETVEFHHLSEALRRSEELNRVRDTLRVHVESLYPELVRYSVG
jgi:hypothetical protein